MSNRPRIAYVGHHGTTKLFMAVHAKLVAHHQVWPDPGVVTFNSYWKRYVHDLFPQATVYLWPSTLRWRRLIRQRGKGSAFAEDAGLLRAWKIDKVLRSHELSEVGVLWAECLRRAEAFVSEFKPDVVLTEIIQSLPCFALYTVCKRLRLPFVQVAGSRLQGRMEFFLDERGVPIGLDQAFEPSAEGLAFARRYMATVRDQAYAGPSYMKSFVNKKVGLGKSDVIKTWRYVAEQLQGGLFEPTSPSFLHPFVSKWRARRASRPGSMPSFNTLDQMRALGGKHLLFPLHVTPEASTDVWAPKFNDMLQTARRLLNHLPKGWNLIMKEHPTSIYLQRHPAEAKALRALPNSLFLSPTVSNDALLKECVLVVINSTLGLEAMIKGYPVITLGQPFYDLSGNTLVCSKIEDLPLLLAQAETFRPDAEQVEKFIARYYDCTSEGNPVNPDLFLNSAHEDNINQIADNFSRRFLHVKDKGLAGRP